MQKISVSAEEIPSESLNTPTYSSGKGNDIKSESELFIAIKSQDELLIEPILEYLESHPILLSSGFSPAINSDDSTLLMTLV